MTPARITINKTTKQQNNKTTKQQNNKTTKQQNNKTTKQQNNKTTKQQQDVFMIYIPFQSRVTKNGLKNIWQ